MASLSVCLEARVSHVLGSVGYRGARMENALGKARGFWGGLDLGMVRWPGLVAHRREA